MNNTFNTRRFKLLFKKTLLERPMQLLGFTGLSFLLVLILYVLLKTFSGIGTAQNLSFIWGLAGGGCFLSSFVFAYFSSPSAGSSYLTLPASHFEKWLCGILIAAVLYPLLFLLFFRMMDAGFVAAYHNSLDPASPFYKQQFDAVYGFAYDDNIAAKVYFLFLIFSSTMLLGSLYFNKTGFIKSAITCCVICSASYGLNWLIARILFGEINEATLFYHVTIPVGKEEGSIELPARVANIFQYSVCYVMPVLLYALAYIRLKEKEF